MNYNNNNNIIYYNYNYNYIYNICYNYNYNYYNNVADRVCSLCWVVQGVLLMGVLVMVTGTYQHLTTPSPSHDGHSHLLKLNIARDVVIPQDLTGLKILPDGPSNEGKGCGCRQRKPQ